MSVATTQRLTVALTLPGETLTTGVRELLDHIRELADRVGDGVITVNPDPGPPPPVVDAAGVPGTGVDSPVLRIVPQSRTAWLGSRALELTRVEFDLVHFLAERPRRVFTRLELLRAVWGGIHSGVRTVDVHVRRLRVKVGDNSPLVTTVYGVGYRLAEGARVVVVREP